MSEWTDMCGKWVMQWRITDRYSHIKWSHEGLRTALEIETIFRLLVNNLKKYWLQGKCFPNEINSSYKKSLQGQICSFVCFFLRMFPRLKTSFFETVSKLFTYISFYLFSQTFYSCSDMRCSYDPGSWSQSPVKAIALLWRP